MKFYVLIEYVENSKKIAPYVLLVTTDEKEAKNRFTEWIETVEKYKDPPLTEGAIEEAWEVQYYDTKEASILMEVREGK